MKKLLFIINSLASGGAENVLINLVNALDPSKYEIDVLTMSPPGGERAALLGDHVTLRSLYETDPATKNSPVARYGYGIAREFVPRFILRKKAKLDGYDAVIDYKGVNTNLLRAAKCRKILWSHGDRSLKTNPVERDYVERYGKKPNERFKQRVYLKTLKKCDRIVCISETLKDHFIERFGFEDKISVVHNVLEADKIVARSKEEAPGAEWRSDVPTFCYVTRFVRGKGIERLIDSAEKLWDEGYEFQLVLIGGGEMLDYAKERAKPHEGRLYLTGAQSNPFAYLAKCDVFVCPSETEAWPTVICEALALEKPVITTNVGSVPEILGDSEYGLVVDNTADGVYGGMKRMLAEPELALHYATKAAERKSFFSVERSVAEADALFETEEN